MHLLDILFRTKENSVPWMTSSVKKTMRNRDYNKKRAIKYNSKYHWNSYNEVNKEMRKAKSEYYVNKINYCSKTIGT